MSRTSAASAAVPAVPRETESVDGGCDAGYAATECLWGMEPEPFVLAAARYRRPQGAAVLDAGCGEGRNAAWLARQGARVTAVDVSDLALSHARRLCAGLPGISWGKADIVARPPAGPFDLVVCDSVLHWLPGRDAAGRAVRGLKEHTSPGGVHVVCSFNDRNQQFEHHANPPRLVLAHGDYLELYADWRIVEVDDGDVTSSHADTPEPHNHSVTRFIAVRPGGDPR